MYKLFTINSQTNSVIRLADNTCIPFAPDNADYQQFKNNLANGVELQNAEGQIMIKTDITEFMRSLP